MNKQSVKSLFFLLCIFISLSISSTTRAQLVNDTRVNDDSTVAIQEQGAIGVDNFGNFVIVWTDYRNPLVNLYCQLFDNMGRKRGGNFAISTLAHGPGIAVRRDGSFGICWIDTIPKFRLYNSSGVPISNALIIDYTYYPQAHKPSISSDTSGGFVVAFEKYITSNDINIYAQIIDSNGNKSGNSIRVNDDTTLHYKHQNPVTTKRRDGSFIVAWQDQRPPSILNGDDIYIQLFDKFGAKIGNNTRVNDDTLLYDYQHLPKISSDDSGRFSIVFTQIEDNSGATYNLVQLYNSNGTKKGNNIRFSSTSASEQYPLISKRRNGDMVVCFRRDASANYIPYIQRINSSGSNIGDPFVVSSYYTTTEKITSSLAFYDDKIITVWNDGRNGSQDVFFNIRSYINPDSITSIQQISSEIPDKYELFQNYPNPFNPKTYISFNILKSSFVELKIYDALGQEIKCLINESLQKGKFKVSFDGNGLSSGVYFYSLIVNGNFVSTKKMCLIK